MPYPASPKGDQYISGVYLEMAGQEGDPIKRAWALDHAARVDARRGGGHEFGREVLGEVLERALRSYFVRTGIPVPGEDETGSGTSVHHLSSEKDFKVTESAIRAFGAPEGGVSIEEAADPEAGHIASYDLSVPGMKYLETAVQVIAWPQSHTEFI